MVKPDAYSIQFGGGMMRREALAIADSYSNVPRSSTSATLK